MAREDAPGDRLGPLAPEEVAALLARGRTGDPAAREELVSANLRLVRSVARRFAGRAEDDDLFQAGCVGLLKAVDGFDPARGTRFSTYAVPFIIGEIRQHLREARSLKVGRGLRALERRARRAREELAQELGRSPTITELARTLGTSREEVVAALDAAEAPLSLDEVAFEDQGDPIRVGDRLAAGGPGPDAVVVENLALRQVLAELAPWERELLLLRFFCGRTQQEVAASLGISQPQVSRAERRLLRQVRTRLA